MIFAAGFGTLKAAVERFCGGVLKFRYRMKASTFAEAMVDRRRHKGVKE